MALVLALLVAFSLSVGLAEQTAEEKYPVPESIYDVPITGDTTTEYPVPESIDDVPITGDTTDEYPVPESIDDVPMSEITANGVKYKLDNKNLTATAAGVEDQTLKKIKILDKLTIYDRTYRVTAIGKGAFKGLKQATTATIGKYVKTIGKNAFNDCGKLATVTFKGTKLKTIDKNAFKGIAGKATFKCGSKLNEYKTLIQNAGASKKAVFTK